MIKKIKSILFPNTAFTIFFFSLAGFMFFQLHSLERTLYNIAVIPLHCYLWNLPFHIFTDGSENPGIFRFFKLHRTEEFLGNTKIGVLIFFIVWIALAVTAWHYLPIERL